MIEPRKLQTGFSLLELLLALVVFSIGMLAVAALQTVSKQANFEGAQRTSASQIAYGLLEDIRTNGDALDIYRTAGEFGGGRRGGVGGQLEGRRRPPAGGALPVRVHGVQGGGRRQRTEGRPRQLAVQERTLLRMT